MTCHIVHRLVGYDPVTDRVAYSHDIPTEKLAFAKAVAHVAPTDPDAIGCYPLSDPEARDIAGTLNIALPQAFRYFLEPADTSSD
jgi:hypothetical protein